MNFVSLKILPLSHRLQNQWVMGKGGGSDGPATVECSQQLSGKCDKEKPLTPPKKPEPVVALFGWLLAGIPERARLATFAATGLILVLMIVGAKADDCAWDGLPQTTARLGETARLLRELADAQQRIERTAVANVPIIRTLNDGEARDKIADLQCRLGRLGALSP